MYGYMFQIFFPAGLETEQLLYCLFAFLGAEILSKRGPLSKETIFFLDSNFFLKRIDLSKMMQKEEDILDRLENAITSQWAYGAKMMSFRRRCDVITSHRR